MLTYCTYIRFFKCIRYIRNLVYIKKTNELTFYKMTLMLQFILINIKPYKIWCIAQYES